MPTKIALAGNPNSGKTTLFNVLTGSNQFVGNWPGVTVEKKEGRLKKYDDVIVTDLPGIYSLSPYTPEEIVARRYLIDEHPDVILNIVDASNLERNLYLTTQLLELGIPTVVALNMMDAVEKLGDRIDAAALGRRLGCAVVPISALRGEGIAEVTEAALLATHASAHVAHHTFSGAVEHALAHIEEAILHSLPTEKQRWYAVKIFERDKTVLSTLSVPDDVLSHIEEDIKMCEHELDDDAESIITNDRYDAIAKLLHGVYHKAKRGLTPTEKIDRVVTNRWAALPIFALVMFLVYFISVTTIGSFATDWANDGLFGDGFHLVGIGSGEFGEANREYGKADAAIHGFLDHLEAKGRDVLAIRESLDPEGEGFDPTATADYLTALAAQLSDGYEYRYIAIDEETLEETTVTVTVTDLRAAIALLHSRGFAEPDPADYGVWVPGIPVLIERGLSAIGCWEWLSSLILDGIVAGVGAVLGFVPQIFVLFLLLAFLEACGYMSRIAFVLDRLFRKFGLSGKSFIPMLIGTGCSIPGIMASRTIESESDRRMTVITTSFMPCSAKLPFIALIAGAVFGGAWWVAPSAYFLGIVAIILSGLLLKRTRAFASEPTPFVMELPSYHMPRLVDLLRSMWERGWSFIKKAATIILLSTIVLWFLTYFGFTEDGFRMLAEEEVEMSLLAAIGSAFAWIFAPLGFGTWQAAVASVTGLIAKENIVGTLSILYGDRAGVGAVFTAASGYAFLVFNLLCAPCFAAIGAIRREMRSAKWTLFALGYQTGLAWLSALAVNHLVGLFTGGAHWLGVTVSILLVLALVGFLLYPTLKRRRTA